jgi:hypothetical protein
MPKRSLSLGLVALAAAAVVLPLQAQANHENRYFGFSTGYQPYPYYYPPPAYAPPPRVRQYAPGVYEYEVSPGRWVRTYPGYGIQPPTQRDRRVRSQPQSPAALRSTEPPPIPKSKPELAVEPDEPAEPRVAVQSAPATASTTSSITPPPASATASDVESAPDTTPDVRLSCEAASDIIKGFGFSDVQPTSCSGQVYDFSAARDGSAYVIKLSAADGELTEVRKR